MNQVEIVAKALPVLKRVGSQSQTAKCVADLLTGLIEKDTTMRKDLRQMAASEQGALALIEKAVRDIWDDRVSFEHALISPRIPELPDYTHPYFSADQDHPNGLPFEDVYSGRYDLVVKVAQPDPTPGARHLYFNSHVDVVKPWIPARIEGNFIFGRGACDAKGQCVTLVLSQLLLKELMAEASLELAQELVYEFVIEEETGGNGSLSLAADYEGKMDCIVVCEPTQKKFHPGNRGASWYELKLDACGNPDISLLELAAEAVLEMENEGRQILSESDHPLFPSRPVQTCHGILGPWGSHPSGVNAWVGLCVMPATGRDVAALTDEIRPVVESAIQKYTDRYGDKTKEPDPDDPSGKQMKVLRHYDIAPAADHVWLGIYGKSGHMGSTPLLDGAITKSAYVVKELAERGFNVTLSDAPPQPEQVPPTPENSATRPFTPTAEYRSRLVLEGGQGFVPTHDIKEVQERLVGAVGRALESYCRRAGIPAEPDMARITFDKLHNNAYARSAESEAVSCALAAASEFGLYSGETVDGWKVSCDARLFADHRPDADILTFGPGSLDHAHSENEQIKVSDIISSAQTLALFALLYVGVK